jgi:hypothetical protein
LHVQLKDNLKLKMLAERTCTVSKGFFGLPIFVGYAIRDGSLQPLLLKQDRHPYDDAEEETRLPVILRLPGGVGRGTDPGNSTDCYFVLTQNVSGI